MSEIKTGGESHCLAANVLQLKEVRIYLHKDFLTDKLN